ncbi:exodeoxyribonuclease VII large subunit [Flavobacterium johnsoniae]|uniref:exodeoxyribonuclease VII large subunit n=1 Tax=Flavobacterium johnsoniae TaxID=986 RepID=UPI00223B5781|nr:exodeoxyribonuclease VII large subunit [Flavobacterium johnsoniae]
MGILALQKNIVIKSQQLFLQYHNELNSLKNAVAHNARKLISVQKEELVMARQHIVQTGRSLLNDKKQQLLLTAQLTLQRPQGIIQQKNSNLRHLKANLKIFTSHYLRSRKLQLEDCRKTIKLLSPQHVLSRGYAVVRVHDKIINGAGSIQEGEQIEILLKDAILKSTVNEKIHYDGKHTDL